MAKTIGILGGMGPMATADLFAKITALTQADCDNNHIRIYIDSNAQIPDRTGCIVGGGPSPVGEMTSALRHLELCGADCIIMPCNTAHYFLPQLQALTQVPFVSMLTATAQACRAQFPGKTAGVLATQGTYDSGVYAQALTDAGVPFILPEDADRQRLMTVIYDGVKKGRPMDEVRLPMEAVLSNMAAQGADYFILGCTELPIAAQELHLPQAFVDPTTELAKAAITFCGYTVRG